jgi:hypothetical protein
MKKYKFAVFKNFIFLIICACFLFIVPLSFSLAENVSSSHWQTNISSKYALIPHLTTLSGLHVDENTLQDRHGKIIVLHGVNRSGGEYMCVQGRGFMDGPVDAASVQAIASWHVNAVRVPLNEHCWLGLSDVLPQYSGYNYRQFVRNYVKLLNQYGLYVILDLHWSGALLGATSSQPMPDKTYAPAFWKSVASSFKNNTTVLFDVFNEPYPDNNQDTINGWNCWKNGGLCSGIPYKAVGMQELVNTIRSTGAPNVILLGGLQYANNLSHWLQYQPKDPRHNIAASWHIYPNGNPCNTTDCYDKTIAPVTKSVPLVAGEVGESINSDICSVDKTNIVLNWLDAHAASYLAWAWDALGTDCGNLSLITDYSGTPKSPNGTNYLNHLQSFLLKH